MSGQVFYIYSERMEVRRKVIKRIKNEMKEWRGEK